MFPLTIKNIFFFTKNQNYFIFFTENQNNFYFFKPANFVSLLIHKHKVNFFFNWWFSVWFYNLQNNVFPYFVRKWSKLRIGDTNLILKPVLMCFKLSQNRYKKSLCLYRCKKNLYLFNQITFNQTKLINQTKSLSQTNEQNCYSINPKADSLHWATKVAS